jgi:signal transduction histidine kinase
MASDNQRTHSKLFKAATANFDLNNPTRALSDLLNTSLDLLHANRAALFEYNESLAFYYPRVAKGIPVGSLGRLSSSTENPIIQKVLSNHHAAATKGERGGIGLPLTPGIIACAPCMSDERTVGLLFIAKDQGSGYNEEALAIFEVLAARAADILTFARQTASQSYLFHKLSLVYQATHAITGSHSQDEAIQHIAAYLLKATSADACEVSVIDGSDKRTKRFRQEISKAGQQEIVALPAKTLPDYPIHKQVIQKLTPARLSLQPPIGGAKDLALLEAEGISAAAIFPLAPRNEALGMARIIYEQKGHQINDQEIELAQAIINIGAIGLEDAIHLETAEARANQLQVLSEIGREMTSTLDLETALENAMHHTQAVLKAEACVLFLLDEDGDKLVLKATGGRHIRIRDVAIRLEEGIAGWVARNSKPLIVNDVRTNPLYQSAIDGQTGLLTSSVLCVPMETRGETTGVIQAINHPRGAFNIADQQMLISVAAWAAIAIDNANLFRRVTEERSRLEATLVETADSVVLTDRSGIIILVNNAAAQSFRINADLAVGRHAKEIFVNHPLGDLLTDEHIKLPANHEITTPSDRVLFTTISEVKGVGRVVVMQDITALKQIDRMRSQLLGTAAHDLKNPLNAIRLGADLISDAPLSEQQRKALHMMQRATDSMTNLITSLLETIRVESSANLNFEPCEINEIISSAIENLQPLVEDKRHTIIYEPPKETLTIMGDPGRLASIMSNLLSNSIKFTHSGGVIEVNVTWDDEQVEISVTDNGLGIPEEEIPRVFEHLFRGRNVVSDPNNPIEGTGLGLALAKTMVEQHGGHIWLTSTPDEGSSFHFTLPWEPTPKTGSLKHNT